MTASPLRIIRLHPRDAESLRRFRLMAIVDDPLANATSLEDEQRASSAELIARLHGPTGSERFVLVAHDRSDTEVFDEQGWLGACGFYRQPGAHTCHLGWFWGLHVRPSGRRRGVARSLLRAALLNLSTLPGIVQLQARIAVDNSAGRRIFEQAGFAQIALLPRALRIGSTDIDEGLFVKPMDRPIGGSS